MDGNIDPAGIVKDLEWLASSGAGGVQAFTGSMGIPQYTQERVSFRSPEWQAAISCAASTSARMGLELAVATSAGWSATGGPWVAPRAGMKKLVWSTTVVTAGQPDLPRLAAPPSISGPFQDIPFGAIRNDPVGVPDFYDDVAVLAFPRRNGHFPLTPARMVASETTSGDRLPESLADGAFWPQTEVVTTSGSAWVTAEFDQPTPVSSVRVGLPASRGFGAAPAPRAHVEASADGVTFTRVAHLPASGSPVRSASFPAITARFFRLVLETGTGRGFPLAPGIKPLPFGVSKGSETFRISAFQLFSGGRVARSEEKAGYAPVPDYYVLDGGPCQTSDAVRPRDVADVTGFLGPDGILNWMPDSGEWTVLRYGYSLTGHLNAPAPVDATGLEVDKLDAGLVAGYFSDYLGFFEEALGSGLEGVSALLSDSIESGPQNWTGAMRAEFMKRRGYDLLPWLPAISGIIVGSAEQSDSFLWDLRKTISELLAENHYGTIAGIARERGLRYYAEALEDHRPQLGDDVEMRSHADVPMGAMWCYEPGDGPQATYVADLRGAASVAHVYGKAATGAESMSAFGNPFRFTPRTLKPIVDMEFALGVNLLNIHTSPHQPEAVPKPGVTLSPYLGQSFTRNETWAHAAKPWLDYIGRCSYLLQQGTFAADLAYFYGEEAPVTGVFGDASPEVPEGYGFDLINLDGLLNHLSVKPDGGLLTTGGTTYRLLYLGGSSHRMTLRAVRRLTELLEAGALLAGWRPERSPSHSDDPAQWAAAVESLWGGHPGMIDLAGVAAVDGVSTALMRAGVEPDWVLTPAGPHVTGIHNLPVIHRQLPDAELFFISNQREQAEQVNASFRGEATAAELWDPVAASRTLLAVTSEAGRTAVDLHLEPFGSAFIMLHRSGGTTGAHTEAHKDLAAMHTFDGSWEVTFDGDGQAPAALLLPGVAPWAGPGAGAHDTDVSRFSGTATYRHEFSMEEKPIAPGQRLLLDLGGVSDLAEVQLNGSPLGTLWTYPFRLDVTDSIRAGHNVLKIAVTNSWWNRLAGDAAEGNFTRPAASIFEPDAPTMPAGLHGPVRLLVLGG